MFVSSNLDLEQISLSEIYYFRPIQNKILSKNVDQLKKGTNMKLNEHVEQLMHSWDLCCLDYCSNAALHGAD